MASRSDCVKQSGPSKMLSRTIAVLVTHAEINICCSRLNTVAVRRVIIGASSAFADPSIVAIQPLLHSPQAILLVALIFVVLCERSSGLSFGYFRVEICRYYHCLAPRGNLANSAKYVLW